MADMPTDFWSGWIVALTVISLTVLAWLVYSVYFTKNGDEASPVWDGNLSEGSKPAPMWWFWLIFSLLIVSVIYLMLYPGLGSYSGALNWSLGGRLEQSYAKYTGQFDGVRQLLQNASIDTLRQNDSAMASAERIYKQNCAACHGLDARGQANMFPDLKDAVWQWGGGEAPLEHTLRHGRVAVMPGWQAAIGSEGVGRVAEYLSVLGTPAAAGHPGNATYMQLCVACHGVDGGGNALLGGPSLVDEVWLYGDDPQSLRHSIGIGRTGIMPAFGQRLDDTQIRLLVAWLTQP
jgi:cytochrome c oxidase cbb3-type subunit 3